jgi:ATP synthase protein I
MPELERRQRTGAEFAASVGAQAARKARARRHAGRGVWFGLGMMGMIGWSVAIPTLLGAALGGWIDRAHPGTRSWTLALLVGGLAIGCWNAWRWVANEQAALEEDTYDAD